jgi:RHS repeat-associated protein
VLFVPALLSFLTLINSIVLTDQPPVAVGDSYQIHGTTQIGNLLSNDSDPDGDPIAFGGYGSSPQHGQLMDGPNGGTKFYEPNNAYVGSDSFTYRVCQGNGLCSGFATVTLTVNNQAPTPASDSFAIHGQTQLPNFIANDSDPDHDSFSFNGYVTFPQHGHLIDGPTITTPFYQPDSAFVGTDGFSYRICDSLGLCGVGSVTLNVANQNPVAGTDSYTAHGQIQLTNLLANDSDPDGDPISFNGYISFPQHGHLTDGPTVTTPFYQPDSGYVGPDFFIYRICDSLGLCSVQEDIITVVNQAPTPASESYDIRGDSAHLASFLANDSDPDGDPFSFAGYIVRPQHGLLIDGDTLSTPYYYPDPGFNGTDTFTYRICDSLGLCGDSTVSLFVLGDGENRGVTSCNSRRGSPVNVTSGNMYVQQNDFQLPGVGFAVGVMRTYNSDSQVVGLFGRGWSSQYDESIFSYDASLARFNQGDGRAVYFGKIAGAFTEREGDLHAHLSQGSGFTLTLKDGSLEQFNSSGKLISLTDRAGNITSLTYDTSGHLSSVTDPFGRVLTVLTNASGQVTSISDAMGTIATYTYGGGRELLSVTYADNSAFHFTYDGSYRLLTVTDALNNVVESHLYDSQGRATTSEEGGVNHYSFAYVSATETDVTDGLGHVTKFTLDKSKGRNVVTRIEGSCSCGGGGSQVQTWTYDGKLNVISKTDSLGHVTSYTYDANGNPLTETDATGTVTYTYNGFGEILTRKDQLNGVSTMTYDAQGNLLTFKDALNNTTTLTYNAHGQPLTSTDPRGKVTTLSYDTKGNLSQRENANHNITSFTYDDRGRLTEAHDALSHVTQYAYDPAGRVNKITHPDLSFISYTYDLAGRRTVVTDERNNSTNYVYDGAYRLTSVTDAANHTTTYGYDVMSKLTSVTDALAKMTNYDYDDFNRLVKITYPAATTGATRLYESIGYDAVGNVTSRTDTAGRVTTSNYDNANRLTSTIDAANKTTSFGYDALSRTTSVTDALNQQYQFAYDALGRQTQITRGGVATSYVYDAVGNRTQRTDYNGAATNYAYDDLNRLTTVTYPDTSTIAYTYDDLSRMGTATNANGAVTFGYDNRGRTANVTGVFGQTVSYGYDVAGNRTSMAIGGSTYASYGYDAVNRLNTITDSGLLAVNYGYDSTNKLISRTLPNGIASAYDYDGLNRLTRLRHTTATTTLTDNQYSYDTANRISQLTDLGGAHAYSYDSIDRLTSATYPGTTSESYTYDSVGNRTASHLSGSYAYQPFNKVTSVGGVTYTYDNNGNLLTEVAGTATTQYAWDYENRLTQVTLPNGTVVNYKYDALGRRIQRTTTTGGDERYVYDGQNVVQDLDSSSAVVTSYLGGPGLDNHLRQTNATSGVSYFLTDHLGSTVGLTDPSANLVEQLTYDSFGNHVASSRSRYTYTGRERDADTGLMYYRARSYDPQLGRFISSDPIGLNGGINPYAYVGNGPIRSIDPFGLVQQGPQNYLRDPFSYNHWIANAASNTLSDILQLDRFAGWGWQVGDPCLSTGQRIWAGTKIAGVGTLLAAGGPLARGATGLLGAGGELLGAGGGAGGDLLGAGGDALLDSGGAASGAGGRATVVIGENMTRVESYASQIGAETFEGEGMAANRIWMQDAMESGKRVVDIGPDFPRRLDRFLSGEPIDRPIYNMERMEAKGYDFYIKVFERTGKYQGGQR